MSCSTINSSKHRLDLLQIRWFDRAEILREKIFIPIFLPFFPSYSAGQSSNFLNVSKQQSLSAFLSPLCGSEKVIRNGSIHNGKPKFSCEDCRREFVENPSKNKMIPQERWNLVGKLLLEKISSAGIAGATEISDVGTQQYINRKHAPVPKRTAAVLKKPSNYGAR